MFVIMFCGKLIKEDCGDGVQYQNQCSIPPLLPVTAAAALQRMFQTEGSGLQATVRVLTRGMWSKMAHPIGWITLISADGLHNNRRRR